MAASLCTSINLKAPWLASVQALLRQVMAHQGAVHQALNTLPLEGKCFVSAAMLPKGIAYEGFIYTTQQIPTRDNLHDLFGGLMWLQLPRSKAAMNRLQYEEIARDGAQAKRSALRNAITLLDESGLLLDCSDAIWQALQMRDWQTALHTLRDEWQTARIFIIGHGLLEQLCLQPHLGLTAHVLRVHLCDADWDHAALTALQSHVLPTLQSGRKPYTPLPVFGIPYWHVENAEAGFYGNTKVFRPLVLNQ